MSCPLYIYIYLGGEGEAGLQRVREFKNSSTAQLSVAPVAVSSALLITHSVTVITIVSSLWCSGKLSLLNLSSPLPITPEVERWEQACAWCLAASWAQTTTWSFSNNPSCYEGDDHSPTSVYLCLQLGTQPWICSAPARRQADLIIAF